MMRNRPDNGSAIRLRTDVGLRALVRQGEVGTRCFVERAGRWQKNGVPIVLVKRRWAVTARPACCCLGRSCPRRGVSAPTAIVVIQVAGIMHAGAAVVALVWFSATAFGLAVPEPTSSSR